MTSGLDGVMQLSHFNDGVEPAWGKSVSLSWKSDAFRVQGWLMLPKDYDPAKKYPLIVEVHGGPAAAVTAHWGGGGGLSATAFSALGYFVSAAQSAGQLRTGRGVYAGQSQGLRLRRSARHSGGSGCGGGEVSGGSEPRGDYRLELRRIHDHVCGDADESLQGRGERARESRTGRAITARTRSTSG